MNYTVDELKQFAKRNIALYPVQKIFNKRVFLPIIPIYYTEYVGFSIASLGLLAALFALVNMMMNVPTGYVADRFGRVRALRIGSWLLVGSTLLYAGLPTQLGIAAGIVLEAIGFAFLAGSGQSMVHDSLEVLQRQKEYSKVLSRAQSLALIVNAGLVALVPLTYAIDPRMPFAIGAIAFLILVAATYGMRDVGKTAEPRKLVIRWPGAEALSRVSKNATLLWAVVLFGTVGAIYFAFDIVAIALRTYGVSPEYLGWVYAAASVFGALLGFVIHHLKKLHLSTYLVLDVSILLGVFIAGYLANVWLLIAAAIVSISFWRYRPIIYQDHLLTRYTTSYKSTILSVMGMTESLNMLWVPIVTTGVVGAFGVSKGFGIIAIGAAVVGILYIVAMRRAFLRGS